MREGASDAAGGAIKQWIHECYDPLLYSIIIAIAKNYIKLIT